MALIFLDENLNELNGMPLRTSHDGHLGEAKEMLFYIRNRKADVFYRNIFITPLFDNSYYSYEDFELSKWSVKLMYGTLQPSEDEWDEIESGSSISVPNIGTIEGADTFTNHPIWIRVYCPGLTPSQIKKNIYFQIEYKEEKVRS